MEPKRTENRSRSDVKISKNLSRLLRHDALDLRINIKPGGFVYVDDIFKLKKFKSVKLEDIKRVVEQNDKQRFSLKCDEDGKFLIRANQGHTFHIDLKLKSITLENQNEHPNIIHGTFYPKWEKIKKVGLSRMARNHIHFAPGIPGSSDVISGMRTSAEVHIYVNLKSALEDGLEFFLSENNVILSPGNADGILPTKYFFKVIDSRNKRELSI